MSKEELFQKFEELMPAYARIVDSYSKIGSKMILLKMMNGKTLSFLYYDQDNWTFGTKCWRNRPTPGKTFNTKEASI